MRIKRGHLLLFLAMGGCAQAPVADRAPAIDLRDPTPRPDLAIEWNRRVLSIAESEDRFLTLKGVRAAAMMHLAMHDALNAVDARYATYLPAPEATGANPTVAAAQAAYEIVVSQYPDQSTALTAELDRWIGAMPRDPAWLRGVALGKERAAAILARRTDDGWDGEAEYTWHPMGPGVYAEFAEHSGTPEGFVFGAGWSAARPFALESGDQFRSPPPPSVDSEAYTAAFREVKEVGRFESRTRTEDQSHLAMWWKDFVENSHNRLARDLAVRENLDLWRATRLFAMLNLSVYDAYVSVFDNKFFYNHWRPYTAIRWAENDGNPATEADPSWDNLHRHTYAFPSYPSAHGCASAAAMTALADTFGEATAFTMRTDRVDRAGPLSDKIEMDPATRSFESFQAAALECAMSRVYLGIHFRYDSVEGNALGSRIGRHAVEKVLVPIGSDRAESPR
ncbi:MAG: haloperoxidase [Gemmatimonadota bacterium]|nr:MAG: haloperoxidase [Gemmatimonadota bacterium]